MMLTLSCLPWATFAQSITVSPSLIETDAGSNSNTLTVTYEGYNVSNYSPSVQFYDADGITPMESGAYSWLSAFFYQGVLYCGFDDNPGIARTAYLRVVLLDPGNNYNAVAYSNLVTISQAANDCPAPDHLALTEGSITTKGGSFTWTGYTNEYSMYIELLDGMNSDLLSDNDENGRIITANFDVGIPHDFYLNNEQYPIGYFTNNGFDWSDNGGVITYTNSNPGCIKTYSHDVGTRNLELYMSSRTYPTIISFEAMLSAGGNNIASFWIDGIKVLEITGGEFQTKAWTQYSFELSAYHEHTLKWEYTKNDDTWYGDDALFLDDIIIYKYSVIDDNYNPVHCYSNSATLNDLGGGYTYRVFVKGVCPNYTETGESNAVVFTTAYNCQVPDHLTATNVTGTSADIRWAGYGYDHFDIYRADENLTSIDSNRVYEASSTLTGLSPNTTYKMWLKTTCETSMRGPSTRGIISITSDTLVFTTSCGIDLPYSEDFENCEANNTQGSPYSALPECWNSYNETSYTWYKGYPTVQTTGTNFNGYSYSGVQHLCMNSHYYSSESYTNLYAIMPAMGSVAMNTLQLSFQACHGRDNYNNIPLNVGVMTDPDDISTFELVESIEITGVNTDVWGNDVDGYQYYGYNLYTVDFSGYTGEGKHIAFMMEPATSSEVTKIIYIDDINCVSNAVPSSSCNITFDLVDSYGDSWNGNAIEVRDASTGELLETMTNENLDGNSGSGENEHNVIPLSVNNGQEIVLSWVAGSYPSECSWLITGPNGDVISEVAAGDASNYENGRVLATYTVNCGSTPTPPTPPTCEAPELTIEELTATYVYITWTGDAQNTTWQIVMNDESYLDRTVAYLSWGGLVPESDYNIRVRAICNGTDTSVWRRISFTTPRAEAVGNDWRADFDNWTFENWGQTNQWYHSPANNDGNATTIYISNDNGNNNAYTNTALSTVYVYKFLYFEEAQYNFGYEWKCDGEDTTDYFKVFLAPKYAYIGYGYINTGLSYNTVPEGWIPVGTHSGNNTIYWLRENETVDVQAGNYKVVIMWHNNDSDGNNPPASIGNLRITRVINRCNKPQNVEVSSITPNSATISWTIPAGQTGATYTIKHGDEEIGTTDTNATEYTITGLTAETEYTAGYFTVTANCDANDHSEAANVPGFYTELEEIPSCLEVTNLEVIGMDPDAAQITWTSNGSEEYWDLYWTTSPEAPTADTIPTVGNTNNTRPWLAGLTPNTHYYAYVRARCSDADRSAWSSAVEFTTKCAPVTEFPYIETFDELTEDNSIPECWDNSDGSTTTEATETYKWYYNTRTSGYGATNGTGHNGNCVRFNSYNNFENITNFLKTPVMNFSSNTTMRLNFWYKNPTGGDFSVYISTDGGTRYTTALATGLTGASDWTEKNIVLTDYIGAQNVVIVFKGTSNYGSGDAYIYLDDITIEESPNCPAVVNLTASNVTANTAQLSWNRGEGGNETQWGIERYKNGYLDDVRTVTDSTVTIFGMRDTTDYVFHVYAQCDNDTSRHAIISVTTGVATDDCYTVANSTTNATSSSYSPLYGNYCDQQQRTQSIYPASMLTELQGKTITSMKYYVSAGQNYNWRDKVFTVKLATVNEENIDTSFVYMDNYTTVYTGTLYAAMSTGMEITFNGTAPFTYQGGNLLVEFESTSEHDNHQACWFAGIERAHSSICEYGYSNYPSKTIIINDFLPKVDFCTEPSPCPAVTNLAVSDITSNSAHVSWMPGSSETMWQYICSETELSNQALQDYNWLTAYDLFVNLSNLNANTTYHVYVRPLIRGNNYCFDEIQHTSFTSAETTPTDCPAVTNLRVIGMDPDAAQITWTHGGNETLWDLYWTTSDVAPTYTTTPTVGRTPNDQPWLAPLTPNTHYYAYVRARCSDENRSQWSPAVEFTTLSPYIITFNAGNGGTATVGSLECGGYLDLSNVSATPTNYCQNDWTFIGWSETPVSEITNAPSLVGSNYYPSGNTTLYAVYQQGATYNSNPECGSLTYTITYMDGNDILDVDTFEVGATITPIADPTKEGYTFTGWTPALPAIMPDYDFRVIAQWQVNKYNITINQVTGGTITISVVDNFGNAFRTTTDTAAAYNAWVNLSVETDAGYTFGDYVVTTASGIPIEIINSGFVMPAENVTISANFESEKHILTINYIYSTSGNNIYPSYKDTLEYGESYSVVSPPENDGFYPSIDTVSGVMGAEDITISVSYLPRVYQVTLHPRGGMLLNGFTSDTTYTRGQVFWLPTADDIVREGYSFGGWFTDTNFNGNPWIAIPNVATGDWDLYAKWDLLPCLAPENLALASGSLTATSALITWNSNQNNAFGGFYYENGVLAGSNNQLYQRWNLSELQPNSNYRVGVFAYCSLDRVSDTVWVEFTTNDTCYPPVSVSISDVTAHSALLSYDFGEHVPHDYIVHTSLTPDFNIHGTLSTMPEYFPNAITIRYYLNAPLQPNTTYYVRLSSLCDPNTNFTSVWSETLSFTTLQEYAVTIDANITNGTVTVSDTAAIAGAIVNLTATPNHGYSFGEWVVTTVNTPAPETVTVTNNSFVMPEGGVNVSATFIPNKYVLTYKNGNNIQYQDSVAYGTAIRPITDPTREGYTFIGWVPELPATMPAYDVTVHAQWQINRYQLTINYFYFENGTVQAAPSYTDTLEYGESYSVVSPTVQGFNPTIGTVSGVMGTDDITVRVDYIPEVYQVTLHTMGGTLLNGFTSDTIHKYTEVLYLPTADDIVREGYSFGGWFTDTNFNGNPWIAIPNVATGDWDLYAKWIINSYEVTTTVTPDANAGTVTGAGTYNYGSEVEMRAEAAEGYLFSNWTNAQGVVVSTDAIFDFEITNDTAFTANFTAMGVVATPTFSPAEGTYYDYDNVHVTLECSSSGATIYYTTDGSTPTANSTTYSNPITITENTTIKAIAMKEGMTNSEMATATYVVLPTYAITTANNIANGIVRADASRAAEGETVNLSAIANNGYHLSTWAITTETGTVEVSANNSFVMPAGNVTISATFEPNGHTITYYNVSGEIITVDTFAYGDTITPIADPSVVGYTFTGWYPALPTTMPDYDLTPMAHWQINRYRININQVQGGIVQAIEVVDYSTGETIVIDSADYGSWVQISTITNDGCTYNDVVVTDANGTVLSVSNNGFTMPASDVTVTPRFTIQEFTITYGDRGNIFKVDTFAYGANITPIADPTWEGHTFIGWDPALPITMPANNLFVDALWQVNSYKVTVTQVTGGTISIYYYDETGHENNITTGDSIYYGAWIYFRRVVTDNGYSFNSYVVTDADGSPIATPNNNYFIMPANDVTVTAIFDVKSYELTINYLYQNGAEAAPSYTDTIEYNTAYSVVSPALTGYTASQDTVMGTMGAENMTVRVIYSINSYNITYISDQDTFEVVTYDYGETIDAMSAPEKEGYTFIGWNPAEPITMPDSNMTLYAQWELIPCMAAENLAVANGSLTATSALITWNSSQDNSFGGVLYENGVLTESESQLFQRWNLSELQPSTNYRVGVFAYCSFDRISDTVWVEFTTNDTCYPPVSISIDNIKAHEATLHYSFGEHVPDNYIVLISTDPDFVDPISLSTSTSAEYYPDSIVLNSIVGVELQAGTTYYLKMSSFCSIEPELISVWSETLSFTTLQEYAITIDANITNGTVTADDSVATAGTVVNLTATPDNGYSFGEWIVTTVNTPAPETITVTDNSFVMPEGGVNVSATFTPNSYKVTINQATGGVVMIILEGAAVGTTIGDSVQYNSWVRLDALTFDGYTFGDFVVTTASGNTIEVTNNGSYNGFMMPAEDVTVTATFSVNNYTITYMDGNSILAQDTFAFGANITPIANPTREGYTFTGWNPALPTTMPAEDLIVNAQWQVNSYNITINQVTGGTITVSFAGESATSYVSTTTDTSANFETWIQLSADADYGYDFVDFLVTTVSGDTLETTNNGFIMPAENVTVTAAFTLHNFNITVNVSDQTPWGTVSGSGSFAYGSTDTLTATADEGYIFLGWNDLSIDNPRIITVDRDSNFIAFFIPEEIEIISNDTLMGHVNVQLPGGGHLSPNTPIVITAVPEPHYHFVSWSDGNTDNPRTIFPAQAIGLTAIFAIDQHTITVLSNDDNWGQVIGGGTFDYGTEISIQADALTGYVFLSWNDGNTENPRYITVEQDSTFTAIFQIQDGINDANMSNVNVYSYENQVVVANAEGFSVEIFDMSGRLVISENNVSQSVRKYIIATDGIYLVKVGNSVFKKMKIAR